jgi:hypothetical protein
MQSTPADFLCFGLLVTSCALAAWRPEATLGIVIHKASAWGSAFASAAFVLGGLFARFWDRDASWALMWAGLSLIAALVATFKSPPLPLPEWLDKLF